MAIPIDPSMLARGGEWSVQGLDGGTVVGGPERAGQAGGASFGSMLSDQVGQLEGLQAEASEASRALATGQATDPASVVMAVERARLGMQLASQIRTKAVEAVQDVFHTQV
jgi:flagellar hook-basal body complex protein FliE